MELVQNFSELHPVLFTSVFWVVSQFEIDFLRGLYFPRVLGLAFSRSYIKSTIKPMSCAVSVNPAFMAGVIRSDLWIRQKL